MKKLYSVPEIIAGIINIIMTILIFYFIFSHRGIFENHIWTMIFGIWAGWFETRNYYKNKMQSNTQKEKGGHAI